MEPFNVYVEGEPAAIGAEFDAAVGRLIDAGQLDDATATNLDHLFGSAEDDELSALVGDGVTKLAVTVSGSRHPGSSTHDGLDHVGITIAVLAREVSTPSDGEPTGQVDAAPVGAPDGPPAAPDQH